MNVLSSGMLANTRNCSHFLVSEGATRGEGWWARQDSNLRPIGYEPTALPLSYEPMRPRVSALPWHDGTSQGGRARWQASSIILHRLSAVNASVTGLTREARILPCPTGDAFPDGPEAPHPWPSSARS